MHCTLARCLGQESDTRYAISILPAMIAMLPVTGEEKGVGGSGSSREGHTRTHERCSSFKLFCGSPTGQRRAAFCAP